MLERRRREISVAIAIVLLLAVLAIVAPGFFTLDNQSDLVLANMPVLIVALGMTLISLSGEIDISVGAQFAIAIGLVTGASWTLRRVAAGRAVYATGSDANAARLAGIDPARIVFSVFVITGALTGCAAFLNTVRFSQIPANAGINLEIKVI